MKYEYIGPQTVAQLADGRKVMLFTSSLLEVSVLSEQLRKLFEQGLLILLG